MTFHYQIVVSILLTIASLFAYAKTRKTLGNSIVFLILSECTILVVVGYLFIDHLTGAGINDAAFYHLKYGLHGAGYRAYAKLILIASIAIASSSTVVCLVAFRQAQGPKNSLGSMQAAYLLMVFALLCNPAIYDIIQRQIFLSNSSSDFQKYYETPYIIRKPDSLPMNLVYIYAEGFERSFFDEEQFPELIRELKIIEREGTSFTNVKDVYQTGWTMAGLVSSQCGIPLFTPSNGNSMSGMDAYLPGALGLGDLLKTEGYHLTFMGGAKNSFAGKDKFLKTHKFDEVLGLDEMLPHLQDKSYISGWGLYDDTLLDLAFEKYKALSSNQQNFALFLLTLDTHFPIGKTSSSTSHISYRRGDSPALNAFASSDFLIAQFVRRIKSVPTGANTVIVIASDHLFAGYDMLNLGNRNKRSNMFIVLHPKQPGLGYVGTPGSTLDIGATIMPFLGFRGALGLGRNLLDTGIDILERQHIQDEKSLRAWRSDVMSFWEFPHIEKHMNIDAQARLVDIDGRRFKLPVLFELTDDLRTVLKFEFDAAPMHKTLVQYVDEYRPDGPFILITTKARARALIKTESGGDEDWYLVIGRKGRVLNVKRIATQLSLTIEEIMVGIGAPVRK